MVGGAKSSFDRSLPVLQSMARKVTYCGDLGAGLAAKISNKCIAHHSPLMMHSLTKPYYAAFFSELLCLA